MALREVANIGATGPAQTDPAMRRTLWRRRAALALLGVLLVLSGWNGLALMQGSPKPAPIAWQEGQLVANGDLQVALYDPAATRDRTGATLAESFKNQSGETCRRFTEGLVSGTACQRDGDWRIVELRQ